MIYATRPTWGGFHRIGLRAAETCVRYLQGTAKFVVASVPDESTAPEADLALLEYAPNGVEDVSQS